MRTGAVVVYGEGGSDQDFFPPVLDRAVEGILLAGVSSASLEVRTSLVPSGDAPRAERIWQAVHADHPDARIVALHFDATADPVRQRRQVFDPVNASWPRPPGGPVLVPLAPRREMEAWAMADLETLRGVVGARLDTTAVFEGHHLNGAVEKLSTPKRTLSELLAQAVRPRRRTPRTADYLPFIAENLPLEALRRVPSYRAFERSVTQALVQLGWVSP